MIFKRRSLLMHRYKLTVAVALIFLFGWMTVGNFKSQDLTPGSSTGSRDVYKSHKPAAPAAEPLVKSKGKVRDYSDFDYEEFLHKRPSQNVDQLPKKEENKVEDLYEKVIQERKKKMKVTRKTTESAPIVVKQNVLKSRRMENTLNGKPLKAAVNLDHFDAVGSGDIGGYQADPLFDEFAVDRAKIVPGAGEGGEPVILTGAEKELGEQVMAKEAFNLVASDKISLHREVPDTRDPKCKAIQYDEDLPAASVVIIYTNEAWTPLLRTIHSVLDKTPENLLHEIILIDDYSDKDYLKGKLERYMRKNFPSKVRLKRLRKRSGLIRARLEGAKLATGDVLIFLDSHCECGDDWIQPLAQRIKDEPLAFVVPIIDVIDDKTMEYYHGNGNYFQIGGFSWSGHFNWVDIPKHEEKRRGYNPVAPTRTPTMAGGLFAVNRETFWEMGSYDEEMDVWGGENLEMSFRIWQCGGILETIPCSRVGHIFRSFHPYTFPGNKDTHGINTARTVEVWMDDYKRLFYMNRPDLLQIDIGNTTNRLKFRKEKQCKDFSWYLDNIFPQKYVLDDPKHAFAYGKLRNPGTNQCVDTLQNDKSDTYDIGSYPCHNFPASSQFFSFSKAYQLRREESCAALAEPFSSGSRGLAGQGDLVKVEMVKCVEEDASQEWIHTKQGRMIHKQTNKCLQTSREGSMVAGTCLADDSNVWFFDHYIS